MSAADDVAREGALLLSAVRSAPEAPVPSCPGWDATTLLLHMARVHRWAMGFLRDSRLGLPCAPAAFPKPGEDDDLPEWYSHGLAGLVEEIHIADPSTPAWTFIPGQGSAGFWIQRQRAETLMHRIDAELAAGISTAVEPGIAADALVELLDVIAPPIIAGHDQLAAATVEIAGVGRWAFGPAGLTRSEDSPTVVVSGSAEQALRAIYGRCAWADVPASGDVTWLDDLQTVLTF